ncbi:MAG: tyrosine recombinase XerC [Atopobiaceae bacterium]|nr:tyrosine recombinase XerC [Atopobiaceae bacterium]
MASSDREARRETFEADAKDFIAYIRGTRNLSDNTVRAYETDLQAYIDWLGREGIDGYNVSHRGLRRYLAELTRARYSTRTINRHLSAIRGLYKWLVSQDRTKNDAAAAIASPKMAKSLPKTMGDAEVAALVETCDLEDAEGLRDAAFLELLYATGARISEVSRLDIDDVDLAQSQVRLFGKGSKERVVPIYGRAVEMVRRYQAFSRPRLALRRKKGPVPPALFLSVRGNRMSADALRTCFERRVAKAGIDGAITPHAMRHTYATELLSGGADLRSVQELLGHESLATTQIYTHLSVERLKEATRQAHPRGE